MSAYDVLKPTVVTELDVSARKCVLGDENDVTRSHDTLLGNVEIVTDDKDYRSCHGTGRFTYKTHV